MTRKEFGMTRRGVGMTINNPRPFESGIVRVLRICGHRLRSHRDDHRDDRHQDGLQGLQDHHRRRRDSYHPQRG